MYVVKIMMYTLSKEDSGVENGDVTLASWRCSEDYMSPFLWNCYILLSRDVHLQMNSTLGVFRCLKYLNEAPIQSFLNYTDRKTTAADKTICLQQG